MSHPNAPLTVTGRRLLCIRVTELDWTVTAAALAAGISRQNAHKWLRRFGEHGDGGLRDRSSRPTHIRKRVSPRDIRTFNDLCGVRSQRPGPAA